MYTPKRLFAEQISVLKAKILKKAYLISNEM